MLREATSMAGSHLHDLLGHLDRDKDSCWKFSLKTSVDKIQVA